MEIGPINPLNMNAPVTTTSSTPQDSASFVRQIVTAIRGLNKTELLGQGRELAFVRDPNTQKPIIQILDRDSGEVIDQLPPETILRLAADIDKEQPKGDL
jgi:uncharacterized FlaG/YvyC family protein